MHDSSGSLAWRLHPFKTTLLSLNFASLKVSPHTLESDMYQVLKANEVMVYYEGKFPHRNISTGNPNESLGC